MIQTAKKIKMQRMFTIICISMSVFWRLCSARLEKENRPLIYTDGSTGPGFKQFKPITYPLLTRRNAGAYSQFQDTLSFQTSKFLHRWGNETNILLVGGKDHVYMMSGMRDDTEPTLSYDKILTWRATSHKKQCLTVPNRNMDLCENYIQYIELLESGELLVCGSNAFHPTCRYYLIEHFSTFPTDNSGFVREDDKCRGRCPVSPYPTLSSVSLYSETSYQIFAALINADKDPIIMRNDGPTLLSNARWLKEPTFIKMIEFKDYIYIFLRETAETSETGNHEQTYARVARICKNDKGGLHVLLNRWTTFIKARLTCDNSGKESNIFNNLTSVSDIVQISGMSENVDYFVFATFTSPWEWEESPMSAVCAFSMKDIAREMDEGRLLGKYEIEVHPVSRDSRIPAPTNVGTITKSFPIESASIRRSRTCEDNRAASNSELSLANDYYLLYDKVKPKFGKPLYITSNFRATQIAVDYNAGYSGKIMVYVGSENGKLLRLRNMTTNANEWHLVLLESMNVAKEQECKLGDCAVRSLHISRQERNNLPSLFVSFSDSIVQIPVARCGAYEFKGCCVIDPDCGWKGNTCTERSRESGATLSLISSDSFSVPQPCRATGMTCKPEGMETPDPYVAEPTPLYVPDDNIPTGQSLADIMQSIASEPLARQFLRTSQALGDKQIRAMQKQLQEAVTSTIKLVLENHKQEYCLPSPSVNQLVHVYPLLLNEIDHWHSSALKEMIPTNDPKCWDERKACTKKASFSLPLVHALWEPMEKLIKTFSGSCKSKTRNNKGRAAYRHSPIRACIPLPGMEKCNNDHSHENCQPTNCSFSSYAVDPIAFFRHVNDTRNAHNPSTERTQPAPLRVPVNTTLLNDQPVKGHLELVVSNTLPFEIYYLPVLEKVKISFYYKPVKCKLDTLVDSMFNAAFDKMSSLRKCKKEISRRNRKRRAAMKSRRHRNRHRRSDFGDQNAIAPPTKCKYIITKNIGTPELTVSEITWEKLISRSQKSGGVYEYREQTISFTNSVDMLQFFKNDCPTNSTSERKTFTKTMPKSRTRLTPLVSAETPFLIMRRKQKITLKFFYSTTLN